MDNPADIQTQPRIGRRVLLFPTPLQGHISPMLQLGNILYSQGFEITLIHTQFNSPNSSKHPHFTFRPIPDGLSASEASMADLLSLMANLNVNCVGPLRDCLTDLISEGSDPDKEPIACLITDAVWHFSQGVADGLKIPRIVLRTSSVTSFLVFKAFPIMKEKGYLPKQDSRLEEPVPELPPLRIKDIPTVKTLDPDALCQLADSFFKATEASSGLVLNTFEELEEQSIAKLAQEISIPIFLIGPFHKYFPASSSSLIAQDQTSISWLDKQAPKSVIYVSFGSNIATMSESEFLEIAWGLANSMQPFLWVVQPGLVRGSEWLEPLPNGFIEGLNGRGHIVKWAPQVEVLAHSATGWFFSHNGWNSTLESICEGIPMICAPCLGDQMVNARYVSHVWGIGVQLENGLERGEIEKVIRRVMVESEGEEMRERILGLKERVNLCLLEGGSSYKSLKRLTNYISSF